MTKIWQGLRTFTHKLSTTFLNVLLCACLCLMVVGVLLYFFYDERYPIIFWIAIGLLVGSIFKGH
jgi:hypothetical protein